MCFSLCFFFSFCLFSSFLPFLSFLVFLFSFFDNQNGPHILFFVLFDVSIAQEIFEHIHLSGTRCPRLIMSTSCPSPGVIHFSKVPWCLREHSLCKSLSPVEVKQTSSSHNRWSDLFWCSQERQMLQRNLTAFKILASGWPCRKRPWRKAQKNQAQLSSHPSR